MLKEATELANGLLDFIDNSPVSYYAIKNIKDKLQNNGFVELNEGSKWELKNGSSYFITRNDSSLIAFTLGTENPWESGFKIVGAHTDSPQLKLKNESASKSAGVLKVSVEAYGGGINSTWLDRDLSLAGRVTVDNNGQIESRLVDFKRAIGTIPNLAIHLNRDANKGFEYNKQNHLPVILYGDVSEDIDEKTIIKEIVSKEISVEKEDILEMDLFFYDNQNGSLIGLNKDIIAVGRLDNLAMCHSILEGLVESKVSNITKLGVFFDNEEVGSRTLQGADSNFLPSILDRIVFNLGGNYEDCLRARHHSFLISADGAHAIHPNFMDKHDKDYAPLLNKGPVIKLSANFRYATTAESAALFIKLCNSLNIPFQKLANRSDVPSGSTIGPMSSAILGINTIDVGNPMFAMHSIRESQGVLDHYYMTQVLTEFYK